MGDTCDGTAIMTGRRGEERRASYDTGMAVRGHGGGPVSVGREEVSCGGYMDSETPDVLARDDVQAATLLLLGLKAYGRRMMKIETSEADVALEEECLSGSAATETGSEEQLRTAEAVDRGMSAVMMISSTTKVPEEQALARTTKEESRVDVDGKRPMERGEHDDVGKKAATGRQQQPRVTGRSKADRDGGDEQDHGQNGRQEELADSVRNQASTAGTTTTTSSSTRGERQPHKKAKASARAATAAKEEHKTPRRRAPVNAESPSTKAQPAASKSKTRSRGEANRQALEPNTSVACKVRDSESGDQQWILGTVVRYIPDSRKYEVLDVGESEDSEEVEAEKKASGGGDESMDVKRYHKVVRNKLRILPKEPKLDIAATERALAVYPNTTVFYPATVRMMARDNKDGVYLLEFDDEDDEEEEMDGDDKVDRAEDGKKTSSRKRGRNDAAPHVLWKKVPPQYVLPLQDFR